MTVDRQKDTGRTQARNLRRWVAALESGKYKQAQETLRARNAYCCLGVWCSLDHKARWDPVEKMYELPSVDGPRHLEDEDLGVLKVHLGISDDEEVAYIKANDAGQAFAVIAAKVRKNHPEAFPVLSSSGEGKGG